MTASSYWRQQLLAPTVTGANSYWRQQLLAPTVTGTNSCWQPCQHRHMTIHRYMTHRQYMTCCRYVTQRVLGIFQQTVPLKMESPAVLK